MLLRSHDVLHDFFVPNFRARQNIVPGQISQFWFTPTVPGRYEAMCAQLCGMGHPAMRGFVVVESQADFDAWLAKHPSFAKSQSPPAATAEPTDPLAARGRTLAQATAPTAAPASGPPGRTCTARPKAWTTAAPPRSMTPSCAASSATRRRAASRASRP